MTGKTQAVVLFVIAIVQFVLASADFFHQFVDNQRDHAAENTDDEHA